MDIMPVVEFGAGAMEHWGLMTFKATYLLYQKDMLTVSHRAFVLEVIVHELVHQWTGNLVTMHWWNDIWLNEGITSYFQYFAADLVDPSLHFKEKYFLTNVQSAMTNDYNNPLILAPDKNQVNSEGDISSMFDVAYKKGACMVAMMKAFMGPDKFMRGLINYLKERSYKGATQDQLWAHLQKEMPKKGGAASIKEIMDTWTKQYGYPVVSVTRNYEDGSITLRQDPSASSSGWKKGSLWWIHIAYDLIDGDGSNTGELWMGGKTEMEKNPVFLGSKALILNTNNAGYYRVNYDDKNWDLIREVLLTDHTKINVANRAQLITDMEFLQSKGTIKKWRRMQSLYDYLKYEREWLPWKTAEKYFTKYLTNSTTVMDQWVLNVTTPGLDRLGYSTRKQDEPRQILLRNKLIFLSCLGLKPECLEEARKQYQMWKQSPEPFKNNPIPADYQTTFISFGMVVVNGTEEEQNKENEFVRKAANSIDRGNPLKGFYSDRLTIAIRNTRMIIRKINPRLKFTNTTSVPFR